VLLSIGHFYNKQHPRILLGAPGSHVPESPMTKTYTLCHRPAPVEGAIRVVAGSFVLLSLALAWLFSPWALLLAAFVGVNLIQSSFTGFCPAELLLRRVGVGREATVSR
jgi:hypothetical protein